MNRDYWRNPTWIAFHKDPGDRKPTADPQEENDE